MADTAKMEKINVLLDSITQVSTGLQAMQGKETLRDFTGRQLEYIKLIGSGNCTTVTQIANELKLKKPTASFVVNQLIEQGIAAKEQSSDDKRFFTLTLTDKGRGIYQSWQDLSDQVFSRMQLFFSPEEIEALCAQMAKMKKITDYLQVQYS